MNLLIHTIVRPGLLSLVGLAALAVGCAETPKTRFFAPENDRKVPASVDIHTNAGARADATLYAIHFDGGKLNSLGTQKLCRMIPENQQDNVVVYLDVAGDHLLSVRKDAVTSYLGTCGLEATRLKVETGGNPALTVPSAESLARLSRTESVGIEGGTGSGGASAMTPAAAAK